MPGDWLILHGGALGDLVLTIALGLRLPGVHDAGRLRVVSRTSPGDLSACRPSILRRSSESLGLHSLFAPDDAPPPAPLVEVIRGRRVLSMLGAPEDRLHDRLRACGAEAVLSIDPRPQPGAARHITQQWATQLEAQGLLLPKCVHHRDVTHVSAPAALRRRGRAILDAARPHADAAPGAPPQPVVLIHPGSGGRRKCWPLDAFIAVAGLLQQRAAVAFLLGPAEVEAREAERLATVREQFAVLSCDDPDLLAALVAGADVYVGNDAGPTHLAALLGTSTVAVFGPTSPTVWRPCGPCVELLVGDATADAATWGVSPERCAANIIGLLSRDRGDAATRRDCESY